MGASDEQMESCQECGATIYPEHLAKHTADRFQGKLLCPHCLQEKHASASVNPAELLSESGGIASEPDNPVIALASDDGAADSPPSAAAPSKSIKSFGGGSVTLGHTAADAGLRRPTQKNVPYATRCRTFHCRLNETAIAYMDRMVNEWVDAHEEIEIKFVTSTIGLFEGKHSDPNLILTLFY